MKMLVKKVKRMKYLKHSGVTIAISNYLEFNQNLSNFYENIY